MNIDFLTFLAILLILLWIYDIYKSNNYLKTPRLKTLKKKLLEKDMTWTKKEAEYLSIISFVNRLNLSSFLLILIALAIIISNYY